MQTEWADRLRSDAAQFGVVLDARALERFEAYAALLIEWNGKMNLTAITEPDDVAALHFLDSAALLTLADFRGKTVVDVGTGAGFPGMPLRIVEPSVHLTLLDSLNKRIGFLQEACGDLGLTTCLRPWPGGGVCRRSPGAL